VAGGYNLFDLDQLRLEYSADEWENLLMCRFIDDSASIFTLSYMQRCMVDSQEEWNAAHRVPPQLLGIVPKNATGFGGMVPTAKVSAKNELIPFQNRFLALNDWIGEEVIRFDEY
jgi:hypothetical protein